MLFWDSIYENYKIRDCKSDYFEWKYFGNARYKPVTLTACTEVLKMHVNHLNPFT